MGQRQTGKGKGKEGKPTERNREAEPEEKRRGQQGERKRDRTTRATTDNINPLRSVLSFMRPVRPIYPYIKKITPRPSSLKNLLLLATRVVQVEALLLARGDVLPHLVRLAQIQLRIDESWVVLRGGCFF